MSSFGGRTVEYPWLSIDRFDGVNLSATAFFLSHAHADHMVGLESDAFFAVLSNKSTLSLYTHKITAHLLSHDSRYERLRPYITLMTCGQPVSVEKDESSTDVITLDDQSASTSSSKESVTVKCITAGHCAGSVMFQFCGPSGTILYTGDFRWTRRDMKKYLGSTNFDAVYMDTTFCTPKSSTIIGRDESVSTAVQLIDRWRAADHNDGTVFVYCYSRYGHEYLLGRLASHYNIQIHVPHSRVAAFVNIPYLADRLTVDGESTWLHACAYWDGSMEADDDATGEITAKPCERCANAMLIKPCMMSFATTSTSQKYRQYGLRSYRIQYSTHASLDECRMLVDYIKPSRVHANVLPMHTRTKDEVVRLFSDLTVEDEIQSRSTPLTRSRRISMKGRRAFIDGHKMKQIENVICLD